jgi:hypothetical protein
MNDKLREDRELGFVSDAQGPPGLFGVFEDDGETGYLYLYEPGGREVFRHVHVYDRTPDLPIKPTDVSVIWSEDLTKCGVMIWNQIRGIIDLQGGREGRVWLENRDTPGIAESEWLRGFRL